MAGAPKGNQNKTGKTEKPWSSAILQAIDRRKTKGRMEALVDIADKLLDKASEGDTAAIKELGDRLDGKPHQTVAAQVDTNVTVEIVRFGKK
jgi:hypothetical protein